MSVPLWQQPAPEMLEENKTEDFEDQIFREIFNKGFCYLRCELFGGEIIKIVLDDSIKSYKYPVWTLEELILTTETRASTLKLIQLAKKQRTGARVISVEDKFESNRSEWEL